MLNVQKMKNCFVNVLEHEENIKFLNIGRDANINIPWEVSGGAHNGALSVMSEH